MPIDGAACRAALSDLSAAIANNAAQAMRATMQAAEASAKSTTLYRDVSGTLRAKTTGRADGLSGELRADTTYARYVENGTPPHRIEPRGGKALRFVQNGEVRFSRGVNHPGTAERPFMAQAAKVGEQALEYGVEYFTEFAIQKFNK